MPTPLGERPLAQLHWAIIALVLLDAALTFICPCERPGLFVPSWVKPAVGGLILLLVLCVLSKRQEQGEFGRLLGLDRFLDWALYVLLIFTPLMSILSWAVQSMPLALLHSRSLLLLLAVLVAHCARAWWHRKQA